ncbi:MAG: type II toxin-antitoxin system Phd/YefM family antitoxin [Bacteroides sp.]|nr:type II toxin-antitoxin system Phd/YefM family antitoxin [Eubacterium sp.]MCM1419079.1 type II toxin-antitoxin system Phd/YefM family antitoxin [Roseburia sp.]MCM1462941.1 type II toxin-antitoxin system Phd/YefM family antitoxin [Bacteroides sp.]
MIVTNASDFREDAYRILKQTVLFNEPVNINTEDGNAVLISESDYNGMIETLFLSSSPELKEKIVSGKNTPLEECVPESEVDW